MNTTFLDACFQKKTSHTPVWFMRQVGRYLPAYKKIKGNTNILDIIRTPELAAQIALQPVDILGVDAAVLYADIMTPLLGIGVDLEIVESIGPVIKNPIQNAEDVKKLRKLEPQNDITYLLKTIVILRNELQVPLIGFSAAPFTLASYLIEGKPTRDFIKTKSLMYADPTSWHLLMKKLTKLIIVYLHAQVKAGIQAIQLFDSWVGCLSEEDYQTFVLPYSKEIFEKTKSKTIPTIHFGTNTAGMLHSFASVESNVISVDWRMPIAKVWKEIQYKKAIQGNIDPVMLLGDFKVVKNHVDELFASLPKQEGYIFNLGHGVLPATPVENLQKLTEYVHKKLL
jgi:uroporphyrinogen decarboxylase